MRWSENETYQFVKIYLSHEFLWNPEHSSYKMKSKRLKAYRDILTTFNETTGILMNEAELKIKIKNLRSTYLQEIVKIKQRSGPSWTYKPNMKWFAEWHKCFGGLKKLDEDISFDNHQDQDTTEDSCPKIWLSPNVDIIEEETLDPFPEDNEYNLMLKTEPRDAAQINTEGMFRQANNSETYESKKKKIKHRSLSTDCSTIRGSIDSNTDTAAKDDEFDIYGKYIASQLRKMELQKALKVQLQIQSLVSEARMSELNNKP